MQRDEYLLKLRDQIATEIPREPVQLYLPFSDDRGGFLIDLDNPDDMFGTGGFD